METPEKGDDDDLVHTDTDLETNNKESEGKYQIEESKKYYLESDKSETDERDQRENEERFKMLETPKKVDNDDLVYDDTDQETNNEELEE